MNHSFLKAVIVCNVSFAFHHKKSIKEEILQSRWYLTSTRQCSDKQVHKERQGCLLWCVHYILLEDILLFRNIKCHTLLQPSHSLLHIWLFLGLDYKQICQNPGWIFYQFYSVVIILEKFAVVWFCLFFFF